MKQVTAHGPAARLARAEGDIWCWLCGRPLRQAEDFGQWRIRVARPSALWDLELRAVCPAHYEDRDAGGDRGE